MAKTLKDKANYYLHHLAHNDPYMVNKEKHKIPAEQVPVYLKPMIDKLNFDYNVAMRHGNNRNMYSKAKVIDRRIQRSKDKNSLIKEINHAYA